MEQSSSRREFAEASKHPVSVGSRTSACCDVTPPSSGVEAGGFLPGTSCIAAFPASPKAAVALGFLGLRESGGPQLKAVSLCGRLRATRIDRRRS